MSARIDARRAEGVRGNHAGSTRRKSSALSTVGRPSNAVSNAAYTDRRHEPHDDAAGWHMAIPHLIGRSGHGGRNRGALQSDGRRNWKPTVPSPASVPPQIPPSSPTVRSLTADHLSTRYAPYVARVRFIPLSSHVNVPGKESWLVNATIGCPWNSRAASCTAGGCAVSGQAKKDMQWQYDISPGGDSSNSPP